MLPKGAACLLLLLLALAPVLSYERIYIRRGGINTDEIKHQNRRSFDTASSPSPATAVFDPDVLNRFLEEYASKMKRTTERPQAYDEKSKVGEAQDNAKSERNGTDAEALRHEPLPHNDTIKRHKYYSANSHNEDNNRNSGWVTLDAVPWSKSKISKWQASPSTSRPWPVDSKPWDSKPSYNKQPWNSDYPRPSNYESSKPWQNKPSKPSWSDNLPASSNKPWHSQDRPRPQDQYPSSSIDAYGGGSPSQAQKWPPERPSYDRYGEPSRPSADIITDDGPPNFPSSNSWDRPGQRPSYTHHMESYVNEHGSSAAGGGWNDRNDFPQQQQQPPHKYQRPDEDNYYDNRPHFSQYQYPTRSEQYHPSNYPSTGDGQWVLLSTNRGYTKTRQRALKLDNILDGINNVNKKHASHNDNDEEEHVPAVTSKRQIRLTVLPSINGTNTTTSHGGLLEVEKTFKTVDQSQKEYEQAQKNKKLYGNINGDSKDHLKPLQAGIVFNGRPVRNGNIVSNGGAPSSSAVLAAVGAGMLPATMAMMIPMMLGRKKRSAGAWDNAREEADDTSRITYVRLPKQIFVRDVRKRRI